MNIKNRILNVSLAFGLVFLVIACEKDEVQIEQNLYPTSQKKSANSIEIPPDGYKLVSVFNFERLKGKPLKVYDTFELINPRDSIIIRVENGPEGFYKTSSANLKLNDIAFLCEEDLNQTVDLLEYRLLGKSSNTIEASIKGKPGSSLKVYIYKKALHLDLIAYFPFNGNSDDESGNGYDGINSNVQLVADRFGNPSAAYRFNGNSAIRIGDLDIEYPFSISMWIYVEDSDGKRWVLNKSGKNNTDNYGIILIKGEIIFTIKSDNLIGNLLYESAKVSAPVVENSWLNIVLAWDGALLKMYLNGILMDEESANFDSLITNNTLNTTLGNRESGICHGQHPFIGILDEVIFINGSLDENEVIELFLEGFTF